jgi:hypothetical protein
MKTISRSLDRRFIGCGALILLSLCGPAAAGRAAEDVARSMVGYWTFDEGEGRTAYDYSGDGHQGIIHGGAQWDEGRFGKALHFNGVDSSVEVPDGDWNTAAPVTFTLWYKRDGSGNGQLIEHQLGGAVRGAYAFDGNRFAMYDNALTGIGIRIDGANNEWVFAAITISENEVKAYKNGELQSTTPIKGFPQVAGPFFIGARGTVGDQFFKGWIDDVAIFHKALSAEEIRTLYENYQKGVPPAPHKGLQVVDVSLPKLFYDSGESTQAKVVVKNFTAQPQQGRVLVKVVTALDDERALPSLPIDLPAQGVTTLEVPVTFTREDYGCQLRANVKYDLTANPAKWGESATTDFAVADNFWKVAIGGPLPSAQVASETPEQIARRIAQMRANYCNWVELFFWAPDDWGAMAPAADRPWWYSGQEGYYVKRDSVKSLIQQAHAYGMKAITYGKNTGGGPDGWEIVRRHPDWFLLSHTERPKGNYNAYDIDNWNNREARLRKQFKPSINWQFNFPDLRKPEPLDWGIEQIARSAHEFGWDGVRFDGHFTVPNDELSTYNMRLLKERLWKEYPHFLFGFNYAFSPELYGGLNHEMREGMAGGGMWMQEAVNHWAYTNAKRYTSWNFYATNELKVAKQIQSIGGVYHCIYALGPNVQSMYKLIYGLIAGGHPVYSTHQVVPGSANWGRFMTRWSRFLWDTRLKPMDNVEERVQVQAPAAVTWKPLAQEMIASAQRKFWVVHLVNPSATDEIAKTDDSQLPALQQNIVVTLKPPSGERIVRAMLLQPEKKPFDSVLTPVTVEGGQTITVPQLTYWAMVVVELEGHYKAPVALPKFSAPPDMQQVAQAREAGSVPGASATNDPLHPGTGIAAGPNETIWETDSGFWNIAADAVADPDASAGLAQKCQKPGYLGRTWMGPFSPGLYKFSFRMKWSGPDADRIAATVQVTTADSKTNYISHKLSLNDEAATGHKPDVYQYHVLDVDIRDGGMVQCYIGVGDMGNPGNAIYLDLIKTEQVVSYSDNQLATWSKPIPKPANLPVPQGSSPRKILQVRGIYSQLYGLDKAVECQSTYAVPATYEALYAYDAVVMNNVDFAADFATRKLYKDYVEDGGRLVVLGGNEQFCDTWKNTYLDDLLPFAIKGSALVRCNPPLILGDAKKLPYAGAPSLFWRHDVTLRPGAQTLAYAGSVPILATRKVGKGLCIAFVGTVDGEGTAKSPPFWESPAWMKLLRQAVSE